MYITDQRYHTWGHHDLWFYIVYVRYRRTCRWVLLTEVLAVFRNCMLSLNHVRTGVGVPFAEHCIVRVLPLTPVICAGGVYVHCGESAKRESNLDIRNYWNYLYYDIQDLERNMNYYNDNCGHKLEDTRCWSKSVRKNKVLINHGGALYSLLSIDWWWVS